LVPGIKNTTVIFMVQAQELRVTYNISFFFKVRLHVRIDSAFCILLQTASHGVHRFAKSDV